jgi:hypothetical protein
MESPCFTIIVEGLKSLPDAWILNSRRELPSGRTWMTLVGFATSPETVEVVPGTTTLSGTSPRVVDVGPAYPESPGLFEVCVPGSVFIRVLTPVFLLKKIAAAITTTAATISTMTFVLFIIYILQHRIFSS